MTEMSYSAENVMKLQSERFANYESEKSKSEAMKKKQAPTSE
jgi:hypothetical protein